MAKAIFKVLLKFIGSIVGILLAPIDILLTNAFPTLSNMVTDFNNKYLILKDYCMPSIRYILSFIPPGSFSAITFYLSVLLVIYTITLGVHAIVKVITVIKNIKIW